MVGSPNPVTPNPCGRITSMTILPPLIARTNDSSRSEDHPEDIEDPSNYEVG